MLSVSTRGLVGRALLAGLLVASMTVTSDTEASFAAPSPGARLAPVGDAADLIQLVQGRTALAFTATGGDIETVTVRGWPTVDGEHQLGGAVLVETVYRDTGSIMFGEPPMTVEFRLSG